MRKFVFLLIICILFTGCGTMKNSVNWKNFIDNDLKTANYKGDADWEKVSYSDLQSSKEFDIDNDGTNELILKYLHTTYDYGDMEISDFAYIILKNINGEIVEFESFWNKGNLESHKLKCNDNGLVVVTSKYAIVATLHTVSDFSNGNFSEQFSYTEYSNTENGEMVLISEENDVTYATLGDRKEKYLGDNISTNDMSLKSRDELFARMNEIKDLVWR